MWLAGESIVSGSDSDLEDPFRVDTGASSRSPGSSSVSDGTTRSSGGDVADGALFSESGSHSGSSSSGTMSSSASRDTAVLLTVGSLVAVVVIFGSIAASRYRRRGRRQGASSRRVSQDGDDRVLPTLLSTSARVGSTATSASSPAIRSFHPGRTSNRTGIASTVGLPGVILDGTYTLTLTDASNPSTRSRRQLESGLTGRPPLSQAGSDPGPSVPAGTQAGRRGASGFGLRVGEGPGTLGAVPQPPITEPSSPSLRRRRITRTRKRAAVGRARAGPGHPNSNSSSAARASGSASVPNTSESRNASSPVATVTGSPSHTDTRALSPSQAVTRTASLPQPDLQVTGLRTGSQRRRRGERSFET